MTLSFLPFICWFLCQNQNSIPLSCLSGGLVRIFDLRTYRCRISYLPSTSPSGGGRARAESGEQKRRHMSDSILKTSNSSGDSSGDAVSRRDLKARRRSATEAERMAASRRLRSDGETNIHLSHFDRFIPVQGFPIKLRIFVLNLS